MISLNQGIIELEREVSRMYKLEKQKLFEKSFKKFMKRRNIKSLKPPEFRMPIVKVFLSLDDFKKAFRTIGPFELWSYDEWSPSFVCIKSSFNWDKETVSCHIQSESPFYREECESRYRLYHAHFC